MPFVGSVRQRANHHRRERGGKPCRCRGCKCDPADHEVIGSGVSARQGSGCRAQRLRPDGDDQCDTRRHGRQARNRDRTARDVPDAFGVGAVAMRGQRMHGAIAAGAVRDAAGETADPQGLARGWRRDEEARLCAIELEHDGEIRRRGDVRTPTPAAGSELQAVQGVTSSVSCRTRGRPCARDSTRTVRRPAAVAFRFG